MNDVADFNTIVNTEEYSTEFHRVLQASYWLHALHGT